MLTVIMLFIPLLVFGYNMSYLSGKLIIVRPAKNQHVDSDSSSDKELPVSEETKMIWSAQAKAAKAVDRFTSRSTGAPAEQGGSPCEK